MYDWNTMLINMRNVPTKEQVGSILRDKVRPVSKLKLRFEHCMMYCSETKAQSYDKVYFMIMMFLEDYALLSLSA